MIQCQVCGKNCMVINYKHVAQHGLTLPLYRSLYPNAELADKEMKINKGLSVRKYYNNHPEARIRAANNLKKRIAEPNNPMNKTGIKYDEKLRQIHSLAMKKHYADNPEALEKQRQLMAKLDKTYWKGKTHIGWNKGMRHTDDAREKMSKAIKLSYDEGRKDRFVVKANMKKYIEEYGHPNKGRKILPEESKRRSEGIKKFWDENPNRKAGFLKYLETHPHPLLGKTHEGWNKGKKLNLTLEGRRNLQECGRKLGLSQVVNLHTDEMKTKRIRILREKLKGKTYEEIYGEESGKQLREKRRKCFNWIKQRDIDIETKNKWVRKRFMAAQRKPNKAEGQIMALLDDLAPNEWAYVGDGQLVVGGRVPDFANVNGQKKLIELYGDFWHSEKRTGRTKNEEMKLRTDIYKKYGYKTLIIWEKELKDYTGLSNKVAIFCNGKKEVNA